MMRVGFIGAGNMASALIASLLNAKACRRADILACEIDPTQRASVRKRFRIRVTDALESVMRDADVVFLAVKPQGFAALLPALAPLVRRRHVVVSIAAGKRIRGIENVLPAARVVRVMPNLNCRVMEGMSAVCGGSAARPRDVALVSRLLGCSGRVLEVDEKYFDAVTAVSGSGPAFLAYLADALAAGGVGQGLERGEALQLALQTMRGTATLLQESGLDPRDLIKAVSSKGGTTVAGMQVLKRAPVRTALRRTVAAAAKRSRELSSDA